MVNKELAKIFSEMAILLEMNEIPFKPRAYEKAARSLGELREDIKEIYQNQGIAGLESISGIGKGIAERIEEYLRTGKIKDYEKLKRKTPVDLTELNAIEGIGPKLIKVFYKNLKIRNLSDLERAAKEGKIAGLPRCGFKLQEKILKSIEFYKKSHQRFLLGDIYDLAEEFKIRLRKLKGVERVEVAGSFRRKKETIGDLDILAVCRNEKFSQELMNYFISMPEVEYVYGKGRTKTMIRLRNGLDVDLRVIKKDSFGAALQYFTGNKAHNIKLRKIALKQGYKLNEYGLFKILKSNLKNFSRGSYKYVAGREEEEIYRKLGFQWIPPELRENRGEFEKAAKNEIPRLIKLEDIKGDLQIQTAWTDGSNSIEEYAKEAERLGYEYILITDHTKSLAMTGGLKEEDLLKQMKEIEMLNEKLSSLGFKVRILKGAEVNILKDGSLDIDEKILRKLDVVAGAIHSHFHLSKKEQTKRLIKAMRNSCVDIIFHPTTRIIQQRPEIDLNLDEIFQAAAETKTVLEIDAFPDRLDLKDEYIIQAKKYGVKFAIDTDAHSVSHLSFMHFGVDQARRAWCEKSDIVNTFPLEDFLAFFNK